MTNNIELLLTNCSFQTITTPTTLYILVAAISYRRLELDRDIVTPNFSIEWLQIENKIKWKYSVYHLSRHPNLTLEWVKVELDFGWDWEYLLSVKDIITFPEWLEIYPTKKWKDKYWTGISQNNMLTTEFVTQNISKPWNWSYLVQCPQFEFKNYIWKS